MTWRGSSSDMSTAAAASSPLIVKYGVKDPALDRLALIVHGADVAADIDVTPEAAGLKAIAHGFAIVHGEADHRKIELESPLYDALYAWCQHETARAAKST